MPGVVRELRRNGIKVALWFPDALVNMGRQLMLLAPYDAVFVKEPHLVDRLRAFLTCRCSICLEACNPRWHRPLAAPGTEPYLVIAGNMYPSRILLLERLLASGIPLRLYGAGSPAGWGRHRCARSMPGGPSSARKRRGSSGLPRRCSTPCTQARYTGSTPAYSRRPAAGRPC